MEAANDQETTSTSLAHILAADSPIFSDESSKKAKQQKTNVSTDRLPGPFYADNLQINKDNVNDLVRLADKYHAKDCMTKCIQFLKEILNVDSVCFVLDVAWGSSWMVLAAVHGLCIDIVYEHFDAVIETRGFSTCRPGTLQTILSQHPSSRHEFNVVDAVVKWAQNACVKNGIDSTNPQHLRKAIGANFNLIDFGAMTEIDFFTCQLEHRLLSEHEIGELVDKMSDKK
ncbi:BTB/POZ domain-containing protein 6-A-like [Sitodiplosis mosellana]|uniref:BTB/POZ domain-containing protein 6-A-like n=1 Tax=Sitodiplosis mosellana TaxID=263140 RepID=UPI0024451A61|nr:BTB/POZ domain-containing protein 6-A-like [Sitodiplosis mosellana]